MMLFCCNPFKSSRHFNPRLLWYEGKKEVGQGQASEAESTSEAVEASESHEQSEEEKMKFHMQSFLLMAKHIEKKTTDPEFRKSTLGNMVRSAQIFLRRYGGVTQKDNIFFKDITLMRRYLGKNGKTSISKIAEDINIDIDTTKYAAGWLLGQEKLCMSQEAGQDYFWLVPAEMQKYQNIILNKEKEQQGNSPGTT